MKLGHVGALFVPSQLLQEDMLILYPHKKKSSPEYNMLSRRVSLLLMNHARLVSHLHVLLAELHMKYSTALAVIEAAESCCVDSCCTIN
jgi:hypothetical protein